MSETTTSKMAEAIAMKDYQDFKEIVSSLRSPRFDTSRSASRMHDLDHQWRSTGDHAANRQADIIERNLAKISEEEKMLRSERDSILGAAAVRKDEFLDEYIHMATQEMLSAEQE